ncbi:MAG TPA: nitrile hydratase accessory protein [Nitrolancea sp.]|nr:nitrile hydratase accessory protein [Nitrolancea sp.]
MSAPLDAGSDPKPDERIGLMEGPEALPRKNGELVFQAPWEGRAFGMAVALSDCHHYAWDDFRSRLIGQIAAAERAGVESSYYERWLAAFEELLIGRGILDREELDARTAEYASGMHDDHHGDSHQHH